MNKKKTFLGVLFFLLIVFSYFVLRDDFTVQKKQMRISRNISGKVRREKDKIISGVFESINKEIIWNESEKIYFKDNTKAGEIKYEIDLNQLSLSISEENLFLERDYNYFETSKNNSKVVYYNEKEEKIETINAKNKMKKIDYDINKNPEKYFNGSIKLSDDGGYFFIKEDHGIIFESTFSVLGADSGKFYGKEIRGISPKFSHDSKKVGFFYNGNMNDGYNSSKLGVLSLKNKKIVYLNTHGAREKIFPELMWSDDSKNIFYVSQDSKENDKICIFNCNISSSDINYISIPFDKTIDAIEEAHFLDGIIYILFDNNKMLAYNVEENSIDRFFHIEDIYKGIKLIELADGVIIKSDGNIKHLNGNIQKSLYGENNEIEFISISKNEDKMAIIEKNMDGYNVVVLNLN